MYLLLHLNKYTLDSSSTENVGYYFQVSLSSNTILPAITVPQLTQLKIWDSKLYHIFVTHLMLLFVISIC